MGSSDDDSDSEASQEIKNEIDYNLKKPKCKLFLCLPPILGETYCFCTFCLSVSLSVTQSCAHFSTETADRIDLKLCKILHYL